MEIELPDYIQQIIEKFTQASHQLYLVGGSVRDYLLQKKVKDYDFTTDATPQQILELFPNSYYNNKFGTVGIPSVSGIIEITTMRREGDYQDFRHPSEVNWTDQIELDLQRRDFTINAMAIKYEPLDKDFSIIDPFNGQQDLKKKIIKAVGDPHQRFTEDGLRMLRAIRFAAQLEFIIEENTFQNIKKNADKIDQISWERIRDELFKILGSSYPYEGLVMLRNSGLLNYILPEIDKAFGIKQEGPKHDRIYDIGEHSFRALKFCPSKDPLVRFACLIHDVGKVETYRKDAFGNATFYGHDVVGAKMTEVICLRFRLSKKDCERVTKLVRYHLFTVDEKQTDSAIRRFVRNVGEQNLEDIFAIREADRLGGASNPSSWRTEHFKKRIQGLLTKTFSLADLAVSGKDVMEVLKIKPGRKVGEVLEKLFTEVEEDLSKNNREYLLRRIQEITSE